MKRFFQNNGGLLLLAAVLLVVLFAAYRDGTFTLSDFHLYGNF